ncbi:unnamed protein product [Brachionus calyciflorus]|uniref:Histone-lysine N-methyltransferase NSD2 n=1 Tax=Brachionus calyciflorus TaxID=104777 RepID=A0A813Q3G2_9BILA|nr:unnamed protein product [Brachionus calyciflorus]
MVKQKQNKGDDENEKAIPRVPDRRKSMSSTTSSINSNISIQKLVEASDLLEKPKNSLKTKSSRKSIPDLTVNNDNNTKNKKRKNSESELVDSDDEPCDKNDSINTKEKNEILEELSLEYTKLESSNQTVKKDNICSVCEMSNFLIECQGPCQQSFHLDCIGLLKETTNFKCEECQNDSHTCFACKKPPYKENNILTYKCSNNSCGKYYHSECLQKSELFRKDESSRNKISFVCPAHHCGTCYLDLGVENLPQAQNGRLVKCLRCPMSYHYGDHCTPAGSIILNSNYIICPAHFKQLKNNRAHNRVNVTWCFVCCKKGDLIGCNKCPAAYHAKCIQAPDKIESIDDETKEDKSIEPSSPARIGTEIEQLSPVSHNSGSTENTQNSGKSNLIQSDWTCDDCLLGKRPLNGQIVWAKVGQYRWWPAQICLPKCLPDNLKSRPYQVGEFPVKFFGTNDFYWLTIGRCFSFAEDDESQKPSGTSKTLINAFKIGVRHAKVAFHEVERLKLARNTKVTKYNFQLIKTNRPVGNVVINKVRLDEISRCECDPNSSAPCSSDKDCLNRMLNHECHPSVCPAGDRCMNQRFVKRQYPRQEPFFTGTRGWGLKSLVDIKKGEFVNEYVGEIITKEECKRRLEQANINGVKNFYYLTIDSNRIIDAGPKGNIARFANHCCEPNMETQKWVVNGEIRIGLFAVCDIPASTELTFNYNLDCLSNEKAVCRCGAKNCSGFIGERPKTNGNETKSSRSNTSIKSETSTSTVSTSDEAKNVKKRKLTETRKERLSICLPKPIEKQTSHIKKRTVSLAPNDIKHLKDELLIENLIDGTKPNKNPQGRKKKLNDSQN